MRARFPLSALVLLVVGSAAAGCEEDEHVHAAIDSGEGDGHGHETCGLQENCGRPEEVTLEGVLSVDGAGGTFTLHVHDHSALSIDDNEWTVMIVDATGASVANGEVTVSTWSDDCMHYGPTAPATVTTDSAGLATIAPVAAHGGPWDVILEVSADGMTDTITVPLCIPGGTHADEDAGAL